MKNLNFVTAVSSALALAALLAAAPAKAQTLSPPSPNRAKFLAECELDSTVVKGRATFAALEASGTAEDLVKLQSRKESIARILDLCIGIAEAQERSAAAQEQSAASQLGIDEADKQIAAARKQSALYDRANNAMTDLRKPGLGAAERNRLYDELRTVRDGIVRVNGSRTLFDLVDPILRAAGKLN